MVISIQGMQKDSYIFDIFAQIEDLHGKYKMLEGECDVDTDLTKKPKQSAMMKIRKRFTIRVGGGRRDVPSCFDSILAASTPQPTTFRSWKGPRTTRCIRLQFDVTDFQTVSAAVASWVILSRVVYPTAIIDYLCALDIPKAPPILLRQRAS